MRRATSYWLFACSAPPSSDQAQHADKDLRADLKLERAVKAAKDDLQLAEAARDKRRIKKVQQRISKLVVARRLCSGIVEYASRDELLADIRQRNRRLRADDKRLEKDPAEIARRRELLQETSPKWQLLKHR